MKKILTIALAFGLTACVTQSKPGVAIGTFGPVKTTGKTVLGTGIGSPLGSGGQKTPYDLFNTAYQASFAVANKPAAEQQQTSIAMLQSGFTYGELLCDRYFNVLANRNQDLGFGIETTSIAAGFVSAVLGLTGSPTKSVSLVATGFAATIAGMESYQQHYHFGPDVSAVRELITSGQTEYRAAITSEMLLEMTHHKAISHIKTHQSICQVDTIKALVTAAVENQKLVFETTARDSFFSDTALGGIQADIEDIQGVSVISTDQLVNLYRLLNTQTTQSIRKEIYAELGPELSDLVVDSNGTILESNKRRQIAKKLRNISPPSLKKSIETKAKERNAASQLTPAGDGNNTLSPAGLVSQPSGTTPSNSVLKGRLVSEEQ